MDRLIKIVNEMMESRIAVLYGPAVEDSFLYRGGEQIFEHALLLALQEKGVERVAFVAPHRPIFFLDQVSTDLARHASVRQQQASAPTPNFVGVEAPLGQLNLIPPPPQVADTGSLEGIGDAIAIRNLNALMTDDQVPTAVVFLQSEATLQEFSERRTLAGLMGEWFRLPATNKNILILVYACETFGSLDAAGTHNPVPEVREMIRERRSVFRLGFPELMVAEAALCYAKDHGADIPPDDEGLIAPKMVREDVLLKTWLRRLSSEKTLTLEIMQKKGWVGPSELDFQTALDKVVGLDETKQRVREIIAMGKTVQSMRAKGLNVPFPNLNYLFTGNPGTGKTTFARLMAQGLKEAGLLLRGQFVEVSAGDLIGDVVGASRIKSNEAVDRAVGGVLFVDEINTFLHDAGDFAKEAMDELLRRMENDRGTTAFILAGYDDTILEINKGLARRLPEHNRFEFTDYDPPALLAILFDNLKERMIDYSGHEDMLRLLVERFYQGRDPSRFGNAGEMRNMAEGIFSKWAARAAGLITPLEKDDIPPQYRRYMRDGKVEVKAALDELERLSGLQEVKDYFSNFARRVILDQAMGNKPHLQNFVFVGNPGTGKTSVGRMVARMLHHLGLMPTEKFTEKGASEMMSGYQGQTPILTRQTIDEAANGILMIDEAYAALGAGDYGQQFIDELVRMVELYRDRIVIILNGYPREMGALMQVNPGLRSRFDVTVPFEDIPLPDLEGLAVKTLGELGFSVEPLVVAAIGARMEILSQQSNYGNARTLLALVDKVITRHAERVVDFDNPAAPPDTLITIEDVP